MLAQQPYQLHAQKQAATNSSPVYTRRILATFFQVIFVLINICGIIYSVTAMVLGSSIKNHPKLRGYYPEWNTLFSVCNSLFLIIEFLTNGITFGMAIASPTFLHREKGTVIKSLLPAILVNLLSGVWTFWNDRYAIRPIRILNALVIMGMILGLRNNCLSPFFIPFRKQ